MPGMLLTANSRRVCLSQSVPNTRAVARRCSQDAYGNGEIENSEWNDEFANSAITEAAIKHLLSEGYVVIDNVVDVALADRALVGAEAMSRSGKLQSIEEQIMLGREDEIMVLDVWDSAWGPIPESFQGMDSVCRLLKGTAAAVQRHAGGRWGALTAPPYMQLAVYTGAGAKYVRHLDNDPMDEGAWEGPPGLRIADRAVTALLYLNKEWKPEHGGCLRMYRPEPGREEEVLMEIEPEAGRLVLFDSRRFFHEVLPAYRRRWALCAWIVGDPPQQPQQPQQPQ